MALHIIDAHSGKTVKVGRWIDNSGYETLLERDADDNTVESKIWHEDRYRIIAVKPGFRSALVTAEDGKGTRFQRRLPIRYLHPNFMFRRTLFIPT